MALQAGQGIQSGAKGAAESFNRFVEGQEGSRRTVEPDRKDFWDSFGAPSTSETKPSSIGTSAMKKGGGTSSRGQEEGWDEW